jgi:hypothetical protein
MRGRAAKAATRPWPSAGSSVRLDLVGETSIMGELFVGRRVRFLERHRPLQVGLEAIGVIVDMEERPAPTGHQSWVRARFGDFITPWIEEWRLESAS